jgi:UDP-N-acetylglucosamine 1-carboxyvinyltransferase
LPREGKREGFPLMDKIVINGGKRLKGEVRVSGAKNAALPILASAILARGTSVFRNVPKLMDVRTMAKLLRILGADVADADKSGYALSIRTDGINKVEAPYELVKTMRASVLVLGPLVARHGQAVVSMPGGCAIGARPIDQHLKGLEAMGAKITLTHGSVIAKAKRLRGADIVCDIPTVTGTENLMMAATLAKGRTTIENAAREPEVEELAHVLNKMGARIQGAGTSIITVEGVDELQPIEHAIVADRIEAGTFMVAAAITRGDVLLRDCLPEHLDAVIAKLRSAGAEVTPERGGLRVRGRADIQAVDITTQPYPGFPTDMQAQFMTLATRARGQSVITETIFENRYMHVSELARMGADIHVDGRTAVIRGVKKLTGAKVMASDLRASAALILAGLVAEGTTEVLRVYHLDRGYEHIEKKLQKLGADVKRAKDL